MDSCALPRFGRRTTSLRAVFCTVACSAALFVSAVSVRADDVQKHFDKGVSLYKEHKSEDALAEFNAAHKGAPKDATILRWIGFLQLEHQNYQAARDPLEQAVSLDPNSVVSHLNLGNAYDGLKMYDKALDEFQKVIKLKPDSSDAYFDIGLIHTKQEHWAEAVDSLRTAARIDAAASTAPRKSNAAARREDPFIQDALGFALLNTKDTRGAVTAYQKAAALAPDNPEFNYHLALAWRKLGEEKKISQETALTNARSALKVAAERSPNNYDIVEMYAETLFDQNANAEAAVQFAHAAELDRAQYNPTYNLGVAYSRQKRYAEAEKAYAKALTLIKPGDDPTLRRNALNGLTVAQVKQSRYDEAITSLKTYTTEFPADTVAWVNLASSYRSRRDEAGEAEALRGAIANGAHYPNLGQLRAALGALLYKRDDITGAIEQYEAANQALPNNADVLNGLALTEQRQGKTDSAIKHFQAATRANPRFADAYNNLGVAYEARYKAGNDKADLAHAKESYNQALTIDPNHALAKKNLARFVKVK